MIASVSASHPVDVIRVVHQSVKNHAPLRVAQPRTRDVVMSRPARELMIRTAAARELPVI